MSYYPPRYKTVGYEGMQAATSGDWCKVSDAFAEIERLRNATDSMKALTTNMLRLRSALDDCAQWMSTREKMIPGLERLCDHARNILSDFETHHIGNGEILITLWDSETLNLKCTIIKTTQEDRPMNIYSDPICKIMLHLNRLVVGAIESGRSDEARRLNETLRHLEELYPEAKQALDAYFEADKSS